MKRTASQFVHELAQKLLPEYKELHSAQQNAWLLLQFATGLSHAALLAQKELTLTPEQQIKLNQWVAEIVLEHKPIQYILGSVPFLDLIINVRPPILIPRPETEEWIERLIEEMKNASLLDTIPTESLEVGGIILDLCTGSGCIALALAKAFPNAHIYATDISDQALQLAQENAQLNNISNVNFIKSDIYNNIPDNLQFDLIVANPPYITPQAYENLDPSVSQWEDFHALVAPKNGLEIISRIVSDAKKFLKIQKKSTPQLWIEIGFDQAEEVSKLFEKSAFTATTLKDIFGNDRVIMGTLS